MPLANLASSNDEETGLLPDQETTNRLKGGSLRQHVRERMTEPHKLHRATSSLRRVMTNNSKRSKRGSLFATLPTKVPVTELPTGPDAVASDEDKSQSGHSPKRFSIASVRTLASPASKRSSKQSSPLARSKHDNDLPATPLPRPSSPIAIPQSSPAPAIRFEIESGSLSPRSLFGFTDQDNTQELSAPKSLHANADGPVKRPLSRIMSRKRPKSTTKDRSREHSSEDLPRVHIPKRASADHWRMRSACRKRSQHTDEQFTCQDLAVGLPSPMPGTNLPLDDPFESPSSIQKDEVDKTLLQPQWTPRAILSVDGVMDNRAMDGAALLLTDDQKHPLEDRHDSTQIETDLVKSSLEEHRVDGETPSSEAKEEMDLENMKVALFGHRKATSSPAADKEQLLDSEEDSSHDHTCRPSSPVAQILRNLEPDSEGMYACIIRSTAEVPRIEQQTGRQGSNLSPGSRSPVRLQSSSTREDPGSCQSPLVTQCLFYSSSDEEDSNGEHDSVLSAADQYLHTIQAIASNGVAGTEDDASNMARVNSRSTLETLVEVSGESPSNEHSQPTPTPNSDCNRPPKKRRSSSFDLLEYWRNETELRDEGTAATMIRDDLESLDRGHQFALNSSNAFHLSTTEPSPIKSPQQTIRRRDSDCFIPVCNICGFIDDHVCLPSFDTPIDAQQDGPASDHGNEFVNIGTFGMSESTPEDARHGNQIPGSIHADTDLFTPEPQSTSLDQSLKRRAASSEDFDPFCNADNVQKKLQWSTKNPFEPLSRCRARDNHSVSAATEIENGNTSIKSRIQGRGCLSPAKIARCTPKGRPRVKSDRSASFRSDTDLDSDVDDTEFSAAGVRLDTFHAWM